MKNANSLTHQEIMGALSDCFRQLTNTPIAHKDMQKIIGKGKAASQLVTAMHREQILEAKREGTKKVINITQRTGTKRLSSKKSKS